MSRRLNIGIVVVAALLVGGLALAFQQLYTSPPATAEKFSVAVCANGPLLLDTQSGQTWVLYTSVDHYSVWLPVRSISGNDEMFNYLRFEDLIAERAESDEHRTPRLKNSLLHRLDIRRDIELELAKKLKVEVLEPDDNNWSFKTSERLKAAGIKAAP